GGGGRGGGGGGGWAGGVRGGCIPRARGPRRWPRQARRARWRASRSRCSPVSISLVVARPAVLARIVPLTLAGGAGGQRWQRRQQRVIVVLAAVPRRLLARPGRTGAPWPGVPGPGVPCVARGAGPAPAGGGPAPPRLAAAAV